MKAINLVVIAVLAAGCATYKITPIKCSVNNQWKTDRPVEDVTPFIAQSRFYLSNVRSTLIDPTDILRQAGINCRDVVEYSIETQSDFKSVLGEFILAPNIVVKVNGKHLRHDVSPTEGAVSPITHGGVKVEEVVEESDYELDKSLPSDVDEFLNDDEQRDLDALMNGD